jgi:hypothetical protein
MGSVVVKAPESVPTRPSAPPSRHFGEQPWWRSAKGMAIVLPILATTVTGVLGGLTAGVIVPIIRAAREPHEGAKAKDLAEAKRAGENCVTAVTSEKAARLAREQELSDALHKAEGRISELANQMPIVKPRADRPPSPSR